MKNRKPSRFRQWYEGDMDFDKMMSRPAESIPVRQVKDDPHNIPEKISTYDWLEKDEIKASRVGYVILSVIFCLILAAVFIGVINFLPGFADESAPTANEIYEHYVGQGRDQTGAVNTVAGMILDYRAFDTLGESFVLFTATCAVLLLLEKAKKSPLKKKKEENEEAEAFSFTGDPIVCLVTKLVVPVILVFGIYVLFNGHLSPGGGFSGGAILGTGLILYAMAYGEERAAKVIPAKAIRVITVASLSFYCLSKSYSFFTGNEFNGVHSVITPGTPGDLFSGGLILPLNLAVGFVVCCTMYSFYMVFKRGRLD